MDKSRIDYDLIYKNKHKLIEEIVEIVFSNKYPEYKEDELIELLKPYVKESD